MIYYVNSSDLGLIQLAWPVESNKSFYTIFIGKNGCGKSRLIEKICQEQVFGRLLNKDNDQEFYVQGDVRGSVVAATMAPFDRYPRSERVNGRSSVNTIRPYFYFGRKAEMGRTVSERMPLFKCVISSLLDKVKSSNISHVFSELDYKPIVDVGLSFYSLQRNIRSGDSIFEYFHFSRRNGDISDDDFHKYQSAAERIKVFLGRNHVLNLRFDFLHRTAKLIGDNATSFSLDADYLAPEADNNIIADIAILGSIGLVSPRNVYLWRGRRKILSSDASSGELAILFLFLGIASSITDSSLIFIDEPEVSLHPEWQQQYIQLLDRVFSFVKNCHFIIASHSPSILATRPYDRSCIISLGEGVVDIKPSESADYYLATAFNAPGTKNRYVKELLSKAIVLSSKGPEKWSELVIVLDELLGLDCGFSKKEMEIVDGLAKLKDKIKEVRHD